MVYNCLFYIFMNILHITDELTKKNYSISSLIFFLIDYIEEKKEIKHHILTTSLQKNLFKDENQILIIKKKFLFNFYNINLAIEKIVKIAVERRLCRLFFANNLRFINLALHKAFHSFFCSHAWNALRCSIKKQKYN